MKLFDPRAALAEIQKQSTTPAISANPANQRAQLAEIAEIAGPEAEFPKTAKPLNNSTPHDCKHGFALGGRPKTWTGKIVSLEQWRQLSEWEKHGPDGRHWNGLTQRWEEPN